MVRNVYPVKLLRRNRDIGPVGVAPVTRRIGDRAITLDDVYVALRTRYAALEVRGVVEGKTFIRDAFLRRAVAKPAVRGPLPQLGGHEMAREAYRLRHGDVGPDDDLGVTGGTAQPLLPTHLAEVYGVVESDALLKLGSALKEALLVTTFPQTRGVVYFRPKARSVRAGEILDHLRDGAELALDAPADGRRIMALEAIHVAVRRLGPRLIIGLHNMATKAEARRLRDADESRRGDNKKEDGRQRRPQ